MIILAVSTWGIAIGIGIVLVFFLLVAYVIVQETRAQLYWRKLVDEGDVTAIQTLVADEVARWKTARTPKGTEPSLWHGVQSAELLAVESDGVRLSASAEGRYGLDSGERREVSSALKEGMKLTARLADMVMYEIPNVRLPYTRIDIYSTFRDEQGSSQRCILSTTCARDVAEGLDWDGLEAEEIVRAFGGRFALDDRGNAIAIDPVSPAPSVPAAFYRDV
ncbi:MAG: hypothetical protein WEC75_10125 [Dehalococcoidia bacterium]